jgi:GntR family transcriptional regulator
MIRLDYKNDKPLHEQITQGIKDLIICGVLAPNDQLPSVRELSVSLTVNPNTVQRAYKELELSGCIYSVKGKGNFVSPLSRIKDEADTNSLYETLESVVRELKFLKEDRKKIEEVIENIFKEEKL